MFNRKAYKDIAKKQLKGRWGTPVLATIVIIAVIALLQTPEAINSFKNTESTFNSTHNGFSYYVQNNVVPNSWIFLVEVITYLIIGAINIAETRLYVILSHTTEKISFRVFIEGFSMWLRGFLGLLWMMLWTFLWSLLFIIPGIVKAFSYSQMFFILAEHPNVGVTKAMRLSKELTRGYKGDLFLMYLSFIGWHILAPLTGGIHYLWLIPYQNMAFTNAYHALKAQALTAQLVTPEDFEGDN